MSLLRRPRTLSSTPWSNALTFPVGEAPGDDRRGGGEGGELLVRAAQRVCPVGDEIGCGAGLARVVMPEIARSGLSGPIGWSVPAPRRPRRARTSDPRRAAGPRRHPA